MTRSLAVAARSHRLILGLQECVELPPELTAPPCAPVIDVITVRDRDQPAGAPQQPEELVVHTLIGDRKDDLVVLLVSCQELNRANLQRLEEHEVSDFDGQERQVFRQLRQRSSQLCC